MAKKKLRIGILFGGRSGEHEVSLLSAASLLKAIDGKRYDVVPIAIDKQGHWLTGAAADLLLAANPLLPAGDSHPVAGDSFPAAGDSFPAAGDSYPAAGAAPIPAEILESTPEFAAAAAVLRSGEPLQIPPPAHPQRHRTDTLQVRFTTELAQPVNPLADCIDVVFPVLHGTFGEDGTIQGLLELGGMAYVGSGVLGSSSAMDKDAMKRLFAAAGLPQTPYVALLRSEWRSDPRRSTRLIEKSLTYPVFVKPANLGSSVGISKVHARAELAAALDLAAAFDRKLVIEQGVGGPGVKPRELEVGVLGNDAAEASVVGEIIPNKEFYDYESKYQASDENPSIPIIPAALTRSETRQIQAMALAAFRACDCAGLARVDFLMEPTHDARGSRIKKPRIFLNEINTMPGFTSISMYPKLWQASGIPYKKLIDRLITLAVERHQEKLETRFTKA